jgi:hypothetical protein
LVERAIPEAEIASGEQGPERVLGLEDGFVSASPWIDAVTEILDDLAAVQSEAPIGTKGTSCIGVGCQGATRGINIVMLIASACVVAGVITAAIRNLPRLRLAVVGYFRPSKSR